MKKLPLILILGALSTISPFSIDMYLAAFPQMALDLHTTSARVALSLSSYFVGLAVGQLFYGPILDRFGRKRPLYFGLSLYVLSALGCAYSSSIEMLVAMRFLQALGGCAASVASMAMVRDFFPVKEGAKVFSMLMLILGVSPLFAPTVGGYVVAAWGWPAVFLVLALIVTLILVVLRLFLPEGHQPDTSVSLKLRPILAQYAEIFRRPQFHVYALAAACSFSGLFVYVAGSPMLFMEGFGVSPSNYSAIFALLSVGFIGGSQVNLLLARRFSSAQIFRWALSAQAFIGLIFVVGAAQNLYDLEATLALLFLYLSCLGLINPNGAAIALAPFSRNAGSAAALIGFLQIGAGAVASAGVGLISNISGTGVIAFLAVSAWVGLSVLLIGGRKVQIELGSDDQAPTFSAH